jgi:energy-coupling factor transporter ATP-binding protein EcfA2
MFNYDKIANNRINDLNKNAFPNLFRCLIIGPSGCGKTNLLINLLINSKICPFEYQKIYIYSKTLNQPKYQFLKEFYENLNSDRYINENSSNKIENIASFFDKEKDVLDPSLINDKLKTLFIFDDVLLDKQNVIEKYFAQGRNNNVSSIYLCQSYSRIPKQIIRDNANILILFACDEKNLKHVYSNHVFHLLPSFDNFRNMCLEIWQGNKYNFMFINKENNMMIKNMGINLRH